MKKNTSNFILKKIIPMIFLFLLFCSVTVSAAAPGKVLNLKATVKDNSIKLSWNKVNGAAGYSIYRVESGGAEKLIKKTGKTSYTISNCTYGQKYTYKVCAYKSAAEVGPFSKTVSATPTIKKPSTPRNFRMQALGNSRALVAWSRVSDARGYIIEKYNPTTKKYVIVKTITSGNTRKATVYNLKSGESHKLRIRSYRSGKGMKAYSSPSDTITIKAVTLSREVNEIRTVRYAVMTKKNVTVQNQTQKISMVLKKGTKLTVTAKTGNIIVGYLNNGDKVKISRSALKYTGLDCSSKNDYSKALKENFVNSKGIKSNSNKLIWISQYKLKVNIFQGSAGKWKLIKTMPCVIGTWQNRTPTGFKSIVKKEISPTEGTPVIYFTRGENGTTEDPEGNSFHNKIGNVMSKAASHGCIRLDLSNLLYIRDNCPVGTTVYSF